MSALAEVIGDEIRRSGPLTVARYMELALYHPDLGYYASGAPRTGRAGHFLTSPELDPAFGELWARGFERLWDLCGRPGSFTVVEVGPGEAAFAEAVLAAAGGDFGAALSYRLVERVEGPRARQAERLARWGRVGWSERPDDRRDPFGVVIANEVLDNLPVHVVEGPEEVVVAARGPDLVEARAPYSRDVAALLERHRVEVPPGVRAEVPVAAAAFVSACCAAVETGAVVFIDYGDEWEALLHRAAGTLVCYSGAGADDDFLARPGSKDITAHANWSVARAVLEEEGLEVRGPVPQRDVLRALGIGDLQARLRDEAGAAAAAGEGRRAVRAMSRRGAVAALADPAGLGGLGVLTGYSSGVRITGAGPWGPAP